MTSDDNLRDNPSPSARSSMPVDREEALTYDVTPGAAPMPTRLPPQSNPYSIAPDGYSGGTDYVASSLDALYSEALNNLGSQDRGRMPTEGDISDDQGFGRSGNGRS